MKRVLTSSVVFLLGVALALSHSCLAICLTPEYNVHVVNNLSSNKNLSVHCWSDNNDHDLGYHEISSVAEYRFHFCLSILETNHYSCDFNVNHNEFGGSFGVFWAEQRFLDMCRDENCVWSARDDGLYVLDGHANVFVKEYDWDV